MLTIQFDSFPILKTNRLLLRAIESNDVSDFFAIRSNTQAMQYIDRPLATSENDVLSLIDVMTNAYKNNDAITWAICLKESNKLIGTIGFWRIDKENYRAEIGYILNPDFHQQGFMQEAMQPVIAFAFSSLKLHSIEANVNPNNTASKNILLKNGFEQEAYFRENHYSNGKFLDSMIFSLINKN